jgi:hypothetical protein
MKTIAISLLLGAGALSMTVPASAGGFHSQRTTLGSTAFAQVDMSSRHRSSRHRHYRVSRVAVSPSGYRPSLPLTPLVAAPYVLTYRTYGRVWGPPAPYVAAGPNSYAYAPLPYSDTYGYARVRFARDTLYDSGAAIGVGGFGVPGSW